MSLSSLFSFLVEKWLVELPYNVCMYGLSDRPGLFYTPLAGKIYFIRLVPASLVLWVVGLSKKLTGVVIRTSEPFSQIKIKTLFTQKIRELMPTSSLDFQRISLN